MDAISVAIVVTVLSLGSALVYLFKADYENRQSSSHPKPPLVASKRSQPQQQQHNIRGQQTNVRSQSSKTPLAPTTGVGGPKQQTSDDTSVSNKANTNETKQIQAKSATEKSFTNGTNGHKQQQVLLTNNTSSATNGGPAEAISNQQQHISKRRESELATLHRLSLSELQTMDPTIDELDHAVSLETFNGFSSSNKVRNIGYSDKTASPKTSVERRHSGSTRKRHNVDYLANGIAAKDTYSSEKLFNLMAASNLSKEEIELAIETLLNKLESGSHDNDWKPAKSDPLHKLRNQLRDNEAALIAALQNHEISQAQCNKLKLELKEKKLKADHWREEFESCKKELSVIKVALDQVRANSGKQQLLDDEKSKAILNLEKTQAELKKALANAEMREVELRNELEEKKLQIQKFESSDHSLVEKMLELEKKLRTSEHHIEQIQSEKNQTDYETSEKISELESEKVRLSKSLKDQSSRLNESLELNNHLQRQKHEWEGINKLLEGILKRQKDEKVVSESTLRGNISELEQELKDLNGKLAEQKTELEEKTNKLQELHNELISANQENARIKNEVEYFENEFSRMLRKIPNVFEVVSGGWTRRCLHSAGYLVDLLLEKLEEDKKLSRKLHQLNEEKSNLLSDLKTLSARINSPTNTSKDTENGKLIDKKNLELENIQKESAKKEDDSNDLGLDLSRYQQQIKELKLEKSKLEAQIKFGLDSLKMEQERARKLEEELEEHGIQLKENAG